MYRQTNYFNNLVYNATAKIRMYENSRGYKGISKINYGEFVDSKVNNLFNGKQQINDYHTAIYQLKRFLALDIYRCDHVRYFSTFVIKNMIQECYNPLRLWRLYKGNADLITAYLGIDTS